MNDAKVTLQYKLTFAAREMTFESDVDSRTERVKLFIMVVDP